MQNQPDYINPTLDNTLRVTSDETQTLFSSPSNYSVNALLDQYQSFQANEHPAASYFTSPSINVQSLDFSSEADMSPERLSDKSHVQRQRSMSHPTILLAPNQSYSLPNMPVLSEYPQQNMPVMSTTLMPVCQSPTNTFAKAKSLAKLLGQLNQAISPTAVKATKKSAPSTRRNSFSSFSPTSMQSSPAPTYRRRRRASFAQLNILNTAYSISKTPDQLTRQWLGRQCGMTERSVTIWFQNKRAKERSERNKQKADNEAGSLVALNGAALSSTPNSAADVMMTETFVEETLNDEHHQSQEAPTKNIASATSAEAFHSSHAPMYLKGVNEHLSLTDNINKNADWGLEVLNELDYLFDSDQNKQFVEPASLQRQPNPFFSPGSAPGKTLHSLVSIDDMKEPSGNSIFMTQKTQANNSLFKMNPTDYFPSTKAFQL